MYQSRDGARADGSRDGLGELNGIWIISSQHLNGGPERSYKAKAFVLHTANLGSNLPTIRNSPPGGTRNEP